MFYQPREKSAGKMWVDAVTEMFLFSKKLNCVKYVNHIDNGDTMAFKTLSAKLILIHSSSVQRWAWVVRVKVEADAVTIQFHFIQIING